jgi:hypothetical protein
MRKSSSYFPGREMRYIYKHVLATCLFHLMEYAAGGYIPRGQVTLRGIVSHETVPLHIAQYAALTPHRL